MKLLSTLAGPSPAVPTSISIGLSPKVSLRLVRTSSPSGEFAYDIYFLQEGRPDLVVSYAALKTCTAVSVWERTNPGIIVAHCLQNVFKIDFTESLTPAGLDRFHVYGIVRCLRNDLDSWYVDAKKLIGINPMDNAGAGFPITTNPISFHYVSNAESKILYSLLDGNRRRRQEHVYTPAAVNASFVFDAWPKTNEDVGHYSVPIKSIAEAARIADYLNQAEVS